MRTIYFFSTESKNLYKDSTSVTFSYKCNRCGVMHHEDMDLEKAKVYIHPIPVGWLYAEDSYWLCPECAKEYKKIVKKISKKYDSYKKEFFIRYNPHKNNKNCILCKGDRKFKINSISIMDCTSSYARFEVGRMTDIEFCPKCGRKLYKK